MTDQKPPWADEPTPSTDRRVEHIQIACVEYVIEAEVAKSWEQRARHAEALLARCYDAWVTKKAPTARAIKAHLDHAEREEEE